MKTRVLGVISKISEFFYLLITYFIIMPYKIINVLNEITDQMSGFSASVSGMCQSIGK